MRVAIEQEAEEVGGARKFSSPNRVLARSFRLSRDKWRDKHHKVQAELEQTRQLAHERDVSREKWRRDCLAAQEQVAAAQKRLLQLDQLEDRCRQLEAQLAVSKK